MYTVIDGLPTFLPAAVLITAFLTKRSKQSWSEVYKKCIFDHQFWAKIPWSEMYKNCVSNQIQWSEMTKTFGHYCSFSTVNLCIKREVIPNKGIPLPRCSDRSPETPPKFAAPPDVEKCHFQATPIWIM